MAEHQGMFEVHITVDDLNITEFYDFCHGHKCKMILAIGHDSQDLMLSSYSHALSTAAMLDTMTVLHEKCKRFTIRRLKMEVMLSSAGVPATQEAYDKYSSFLIEYPYCEFHIKVQTSTGLRAIREVLKTYQGSARTAIGVSVNVCGKKKNPLITLRSFQGRDQSVIERNRFIKFLEQHFEVLSEDVMQEFCILDSNEPMDDTWLIRF